MCMWLRCGLLENLQQSLNFVGIGVYNCFGLYL